MDGMKSLAVANNYLIDTHKSFTNLIVKEIIVTILFLSVLNHMVINYVIFFKKKKFFGRPYFFTMLMYHMM